LIQRSAVVGRHRGRHAQARHRNALSLQPGGHEVEQHVPGGIGEQVRAEMLVAKAAARG
jgi:hypothetical protein